MLYIKSLNAAQRFGLLSASVRKSEFGVRSVCIYRHCS